MAVTGAVSLSIDLRDVRTSDKESADIKVATSLSQAFVDGTGAGAINKIWQDTRSLADGANEALDLSPTASSGVLGAVTFAAVKLIYIRAATANTTTLTVSRTTTTGSAIFAADGDALAPLKAGGVFLFTDPSAAGVVVAAGDTDTITVTNSAGAGASYDIIVGGI